MLTVVTPATGTRLTTVAHVRDDLRLKPLAPSDAQINRLIDQASAAIVDWCRRPFAVETVSESFLGSELTSVGPLLARLPVLEITSVSLDGTTLAATEYRIDGETGRLVRLASDGSSVQWCGFGLAIGYRGGYVLPSDTANAPASTLPISIERAAIRLVGAYLSAQSRDPLIKSESTEGVGSTSWWVPGASSVLADPEAEQLLAPFRRLF